MTQEQSESAIHWLGSGTSKDLRICHYRSARDWFFSFWTMAALSLAVGCGETRNNPNVDVLATRLVPELDLTRQAAELTNVFPERTFFEYDGWSFQVPTSALGVYEISILYDILDEEPQPADQAIGVKFYIRDSSGRRDTIASIIQEYLGQPYIRGCRRLVQAPAEMWMWGSRDQTYAVLQSAAGAHSAEPSEWPIVLTIWRSGDDLRGKYDDIHPDRCR